MTVKDFATLAADITAALPDNPDGDIEAIDSRGSFLDVIDSMTLGAVGPITYGVAQPTFVPQAAAIGKGQHGFAFTDCGNHAAASGRSGRVECLP